MLGDVHEKLGEISKANEYRETALLEKWDGYIRQVQPIEVIKNAMWSANSVYDYQTVAKFYRLGRNNIRKYQISTTLLLTMGADLDTYIFPIDTLIIYLRKDFELVKEMSLEDSSDFLLAISTLKIKSFNCILDTYIHSGNACKLFCHVTRLR